MTLHEGLTKIEDWAFHDCLKLKKICIPKSVTNIGEMALGISYNSKKLVNGRDYTLTWKNNKNIGTASVTIKGKGKYNGSVTKKFRITVQKNAVYTVSRLKYKISNADTSGKGTVVFTGATDKAARKALTIPTKLLRAKGAGPKIIVTK